MEINGYIVTHRIHGWSSMSPVIYRRRRVLGFLWRPMLAMMTNLNRPALEVNWYSPDQLKDWYLKATHEYEAHKARWDKYEAETDRLRRAGKLGRSGP